MGIADIPAFVFARRFVVNAVCRRLPRTSVPSLDDGGICVPLRASRKIRAVRSLSVGEALLLGGVPSVVCLAFITAFARTLGRVVCRSVRRDPCLAVPCLSYARNRVPLRSERQSRAVYSSCRGNAFAIRPVVVEFTFVAAFGCAG